MDFILHIFAGATVGFAIGLTGVGGGSLMTPLLLIFGYPAAVAIGTDLLYAALTKASGVISHHRRGNVDWKVVGLLALGSIPMSLILHIVVLDQGFQQRPGFEQLLTKSLGVMLLVTSIILILRNSFSLSTDDSKSKPILHLAPDRRAALTLGTGVVLGICVTLSSVGAGAFGAAILLMIYSGFPAVRIVGTDIAHAVPLTLVAGLGYLAAGFVDFVLLLSLLLGSLPAIYLGSKASNRISDKILQWILTALLAALGLNYLFSS